MATAVPLPGQDSPRAAASYLPSASSDADDDTDLEAFFLDPDPPDSLDDWSDDHDSADDDEPLNSASDSDDSTAGWSNSKSKKQLQKKKSFNSVCDYQSFFGALRKGFCSRNLDQRIEVYKTLKRANKATLPGGDDTEQQKKKRVTKSDTGGDKGGAGRNWESEGYTQKHQEGVSSFSAMFKCTVVDTPKNILKRASLSGISDEEEDIDPHIAGAENVSDKDEAESETEAPEEAERENDPEVTMVQEPDVKCPLRKLTDRQRLRENSCNDSAHKENGEAQADLEICGSRTNPLASKTDTIGNLNSKEDDQSSKHSKSLEMQSCSGESDLKDLHKKGDGKHAMPDCSNKFPKIQNQAVLMVNTKESKDKGGVSLEISAIEQSKDLQGKSILPSDNSNETAEVADVFTLVSSKTEKSPFSIMDVQDYSVATLSADIEKKVTHSDVSTEKDKLQNMPLQIYMKEKYPPETMVKDSKRKTKAKKVKASKAKKLHLFRDGFTLPSATEPVEDAETAPFVKHRPSESSNKVQPPQAAVKILISKEAVTTPATEDDMQSPTTAKMESNAMEVDGVSLRNLSGPVATSKTSAMPAHNTNAQMGNVTANNSYRAVAALPDTVSKGLSSSASYQNIEDDDESKTFFIDGRHAAGAHHEVQSSEFSEEKMILTSMSSPQRSSRKWFPRLDVAPVDTLAAPDLAITSNVSSSALDSSLGNPLATSTTLSSTTVVSSESESNSESFANIQENLISSGNIISSVSPSPPSFIETPSTSHHLGQRFTPSTTVSSTLRNLTIDISNAQYSRFTQVPVPHNQAYTHNSFPTPPLQQESNPPALIHADVKASGNSSWTQSGTNAEPGFPFPMVSTAASFYGQVIGCVNQTLSSYKQMKSFCIKSRHLVNGPSILPGCCKLFLFNIENKQLHGVYVSSSLQAMPIDHEYSVAFDCMENYSLPLSIGDLDIVLPEAREMDSFYRPLYLQPHTVEQLVTMFERKNKPRHSWVPSATNPLFSPQDRLAEVMGQGPSAISGSPASLATDEVVKDIWSSPSAKVPDRGQALVALEPDPPLAAAQAFSFPASLINNGTGAKSAWPEVAQNAFARKLPEQGVAPSPMALWPHLFPKATSADNMKSSSMHMEPREGNNTQNYNVSLSEKIDMGARPDSESEGKSFLSLPESGVRNIAHRPKMAYNPLAVEQGRQRQYFEGSKPSNWSTLVPEHDLQQTPQYVNSQRLQDNQFIASASLPSLSEQLRVNNINGAAPIQSSATPPIQLPLHYQMDHPLPDALRNDLDSSKTSSTQIASARNEEPHLMHLPETSSETVTGAVNLDQAHLCCYCFTRRADHLIIDCRHLGPCLECAASKRIEYCGQPNCHTQVTRLLRLFL